MARKPGAIHRKMAELLRQNPSGLTSGQLREKLGLDPTEQAQLDRRRRELRYWYDIEKKTSGGETLYVIRGERTTPFETGGISLQKKAAVLGAAHGRCQMCGKTIERHGITLVVDHKIPRDWGGTNEDENLWAICEECFTGKSENFQDYKCALRWIGNSFAHDIIRAGEGQEAGFVRLSRNTVCSSE
jgi:5-methylcytosine-specific restriction endonuclease McrA